MNDRQGFDITYSTECSFDIFGTLRVVAAFGERDKS